MDRKEFFRCCAGGLCASTLTGLIPETAAGQKLSGDWQSRFVKKRFAKLLETLASRMKPEEFDRLIEDMGRNCSAAISWIEEYRGNPEGYFKRAKEAWNEDIGFAGNNLIKVSSEERTECFCPFVGPDTPRQICNCSLGWQKQTFETVLGKKVQVELKESVLRGGKRCVFEIHT